jgi:hypothetical protein
MEKVEQKKSYEEEMINEAEESYSQRRYTSLWV